MISGSLDNDVPGGGLRNYERVYDDDVPFEDSAPKYSIWAYDVPHNALGGAGAMNQGAQIDPGRAGDLSLLASKGRAVASSYTEAFLRQQIFSEGGENTRVLRGESFPAQISDVESWWNYYTFNPEGAPLVYSAFEEPRSRLIEVDRMSRADVGLSPSTVGLEVSVDPPASSDRVQLGEASNLATFAETILNNDIMRVDWSTGEEFSVQWAVSDLALDPSTSALRLRLANIADVDLTCSLLPGSLPLAPELEVTVGLWVGEAETTVSTTTLGGLPQQDVLFIGAAEGGGAMLCPTQNFMRTLTLPLEPLCDELSPEEITRVSIDVGLGSGSPQGALLVDTVEFVRGVAGNSTCE